MARRQSMGRLNVDPIVQFLLREKDFNSEGEARQAIDAMLQWLAAHAVKPRELLYVMLHGPVDKAWHAFLLHTEMYHVFCTHYVGFFVHHTPLDAEKADEFEVLGGIKSTIDFLTESFGDDLSPQLVQWREQFLVGNLKISAVSCVGNGYGD